MIIGLLVTRSTRLWVAYQLTLVFSCQDGCGQEQLSKYLAGRSRARHTYLVTDSFPSMHILLFVLLQLTL